MPDHPRRTLLAALLAAATGLSVSWCGLSLGSAQTQAPGTVVAEQAPGSAAPEASGHRSYGKAREPMSALAPAVEDGRPGPADASPSAASSTSRPPGRGQATPGPDAPGAARTGAGPGQCAVGARLVPSCGVLWGVAPGAFTDARGRRALYDFERKTGRTQAIFHAYHRGAKQLFPTREEIALARDPGRPRILFLNWKPATANWARIARGDRTTNAFLDRLSAHIKQNFREPFFFTVHHEPEDQVIERRGSGYTAADYAAMYRYVIKRLRGNGVDNLVTVVVHMAYAPFTSRSWFPRMYPGDDMVDWIGFDTYAYSDPGRYGFGDFAEMLNRRSGARGAWPGFYNWATVRHPSKPIMVAEWGVWHSRRNPGHKAHFYRSVGTQIRQFPRVKALVHFDTPHNQRGWDSRVDATESGLAAYRALGKLPIFQVRLPGMPRP